MNYLLLWFKKVVKVTIISISNGTFIKQSQDFFNGSFINELISLIFHPNLMKNKYKKKETWNNFQLSNKKFILKDLSKFIKIKLYRDSVLSRYIYLDLYERNELNFLLRFLKKGNIFLDIGSNIGIYSLMASQVVGVNGKIFAFEPCRETFDKLLENIRSNNLTNVYSQNIALSNKIGSTEMVISLDGYDGHNTLKTSINRGIRFTKEKIKTDTLDNFVKGHNLAGKIDFIKLDVEGWEIHILEKGYDTLIRNDAPVLMIEFTNENFSNARYNYKELSYSIKDLGYELYSYSSNRNKLTFETHLERYTYVNLFAIKDIEKVKKRIST